MDKSFSSVGNAFQALREQWLTILVLAWTSIMGYGLYKGYQARKPYYKLYKEGKPMPPWSPILGHLLALPPILKKLPGNAAYDASVAELSKQFEQSDGAFYLDLWPFSNPTLVVTSPSMAIQSCQQHDLIKPGTLKEFFEPLAGGDNLFTMNGAEWKRSRALFNPGFQANYLLSQLDHIIEETNVYVDALREYAQRGVMFSLDEVTLWFTLDIIGAVSLNSRLNSQRVYNPLASAMRSQVDWICPHDEVNPFKRWNPARPIMQWYNGLKMNNYIAQELDKRYAEFMSRTGKSNLSRSIIDLAIEGFMSQKSQSTPPPKLDADFKKWAIVQIRLFLFAGHDSTSSTICYCFYMLSKYPTALARIRQEHDDVFGTDITKVPAMLKDQPHLINQLPYTLAIIKETMRLFPAASAMRGGRSDVALYDQAGHSYPTEGQNVWVLHNAVQRNPKHWPKPDEFVPERWLVGPEDPLYPPKGGWRPFEHGPRNCVGQTLVYLDVKIVLAMTVREFDIVDAYNEWDKLHPSNDIKHVNGERAYQVAQGGAHPADGFPCRVTTRKH